MNRDDFPTTLKDGTDYYIHFNKINKGTRSGSSNATIDYANRRVNLTAEVKNQYMEMFNASLNGQSIEALSDALEVSQEEFLTIANRQLGERLQKDLNIQLLKKLYTTINNGNITQHLNRAFEGEQEINLKELQDALRVIAKSLDLLDVTPNPALGAVILNNFKPTLGRIVRTSIKNAGSAKEIGLRLRWLLKNYEINNNLKRIKKQAIQDAINKLNNLSYVLTTGSFKSSGTKISAKGLATLLINGIGSTSIAEAGGFIGRTKAESIANGAVIKSVGTKTYAKINENGKPISIIGKTDVALQGVKINLSANDKGDKGAEINLNIGISSKFYTGQGFKDLNDSPIQGISSGSGGSVKEALNAIFPSDVERYIAYNDMAHLEHQTELNDLILRKQIIRLFSSMGATEDFSQFMLINGYIVSIWDIINYVLSSNTLKSSSQLKEENNTNQAIVLTIEKRRDIFNIAQTKKENQEGGKYSPLVLGWIRAHETNEVMSSVKIKADLHLTKLLQSLPS